MQISIKHFQSGSPVAWNVRLVRKGQQYGLNDKLTHDREDPLVEFFDSRYDHTPLGQFVSRYYLSTLLARPHSGLCLDTGSLLWVVSEETMLDILTWARSELALAA